MAEYRQAQHPYPGLRPFESWEDEIFFGREEHTNRLLDILQQQRFLAVIGPSGSGKSSLVRAGLLPALPLGSLGTGYDWRVAVIRPGHRPIRSLAQALLEPEVLGPELVDSGREITSEAALIEAELRRGPLGIIDVVKAARVGQNQADPFNLLVLVDQFEEIFTYHDAGANQADESMAFVNLLLAPRTAQDPRIFIALTMRTDFLGNCVRFLELPDAINRAQYLTPRLTREQIERAIVGPARMFGGDVESSLVAELINSVSDDPDQLPILQHALARMWDMASRRDASAPMIGWADCKAVGGIENALSGHADEILASLGPANQIETPLAPRQRAAQWLFRAITERRSAEAGGQAVRRPQTLARISAWSGTAWEEFRPVVEAYVQEGVNFLRADGPLDQDTVVDISHEALIRQWQRLHNWVNDEARLAAEFRRWRDRAEDWQKAEDEKPGSGALLTGADLARALEWRDGGGSSAGWLPAANWAGRYARPGTAETAGEFEKVLGFIAESHASGLQAERRERRNQRILKVFAVVTFLCFLGMSVFARWSYKAQVEAKAASVWRSLDFDESNHEIGANRANELLRLSAADKALKQAVLDGILLGPAEEQVLGEPFIYQPRAFMRALVGTSLEKRREFGSTFGSAFLLNRDTPDVLRIARVLALSELGEEISLAEILDAGAQKTDPRSISARDQVEEVLERAIGGLPDGRVDDAADLLIDAEKTAIMYPDIIGAIVALTKRSPDTRAAPVVDKYLAIMAGTNLPGILEEFQSDLAAAVANVTAAQAATILDKFLALIPAADEAGHLRYYQAGFVAVAEKVPEHEAKVLAGQMAERMKAAQGAEQKAYLKAAFEVLSRNAQRAESTPADALPPSVSGVAGKADPAGAQGAQAQAALSGQKADAELESFLKAVGENDRAEYQSLGARLNEWAGAIPEARAAPALARLLSLSAGAADSEQLRYIGLGLRALAARVPTDQVSAVLDRFLNAIVVGVYPERARALSSGLAALAGRLPEKEAPRWVGRLVAAIVDSEVTSGLATLGAGLEAASERLPEPSVQEWFERLLTAMKQANRRAVRVALSRGLAALAARLPAEQAPVILRALLASVRAERYYEVRTDLDDTVKALARRIPLNRIAAVIGEIVVELRDERNPEQTQWLASWLSAVAGQQKEPDRALETFDKLFAVWQEEDDASKRALIWRSVNAASANVPGEKLNRLMERFFSQLRDGRSEEREILAKALAEAAERLPVPADQAAAMVDRFLEAIAAGKDEDTLSRSYLSQGLNQAAAKVEEQQAQAVFERLFAARDKLAGRAAAVTAILEGLAGVAGQLPGDKADAALDRYLAELEAEMDKDRRGALVKGITALAGKVSDTERLLQIVVKVEGGSTMTEAVGKRLRTSFGQVPPEQLVVLTEKAFVALNQVMDFQSLHKLAREALCESSLPEAERRRLLERSTQINGGGSSSEIQIKAITEGVAAAYPRLPQDQLTRFGRQIAKKTLTGVDPRIAKVLFENLAEISKHLKSDAAAAGSLFEALKNPLAPPGILEDAVRARFPEAPKPEQGYWKLVEWADEQVRSGRFSGLDLEAPLALPEVSDEPSAPTGCGKADSRQRAEGVRPARDEAHAAL